MDYFIGLDIGTSSVKGMLLSENAIVKTAEREYPVYYPKDGWSEQNPQDWYDGSISVIKELVSDIDKNSVASVSFSGQMHGLVVLDENDNVIRPAILWNDSRSSRETEYLNNVIGKETLQQNTGNIAFSGFTAPKVLWLKNNEPENFQKTEKIMLPKDYVAYRLSGVFATDCSDAAGTLYFDTKNRCWSETMLSVLGISEKNLPKVYESYQTVGTLKKSVADELGLNENVKIVIGAGDNAASAVGTDTIKSGDCNISLGTSGTIFVASDEFNYAPNGAIHTFCSATGEYHYLACILSAASCQKWWVENITKSSYDGAFSEYIGKSRVMFLPYLLGLALAYKRLEYSGRIFLSVAQYDKRRDEPCRIGGRRFCDKAKSRYHQGSRNTYRDFKNLRRRHKKQRMGENHRICSGHRAFASRG